MQEVGASDIPLVIGGIIPEDDAEALRAGGVKAVFTPKDADMNEIMADMLAIIRECHGLDSAA